MESRVGEAVANGILNRLSPSENWLDVGESFATYTILKPKDCQSGVRV